MLFIIIIGLMFLGVAVCTVAGRFGRSKAEAKRRVVRQRIAEAISEVKEALAAKLPDAELSALYARLLPLVDRKMTPAQDVVWEELEANHFAHLQYNTSTFAEFYQSWQASEHTFPKFARDGLRVLREYAAMRERNRQRFADELSFEPEEVRRIFNSALGERFALLLARVRDATPDPMSMTELHQLIQDSQKWFDPSLYQTNTRCTADLLKLEYPSDWNDLVSRYYRTPSLEIFDTEKDVIGGGLAASRAAAVVGSRDPAEVKLLLAYCHDYRAGSHYRDVIGPIHYAQLLDLAEEINRGYGLSDPAEVSESAE